MKAAHERHVQERGRSTWATRSFPSTPASSLHSRRPRRRRGHGPVDRRPPRPPFPRRTPLPRRRLTLPLARQNARRKAKTFPFLFRVQTLAFCLPRLQSLNSLMAAGSTGQRDPFHGRPRPRHRRSGDRTALGRRPPGWDPRWEAPCGDQCVGDRRRMLCWAICGVPRTCSDRGRRWRPQGV